VANVQNIDEIRSGKAADRALHQGEIYRYGNNSGRRLDGGRDRNPYSLNIMLNP
jgi:hypothetical protein